MEMKNFYWKLLTVTILGMMGFALMFKFIAPVKEKDQPWFDDAARCILDKCQEEDNSPNFGNWNDYHGCAQKCTEAAKLRSILAAKEGKADE